jgi:endonuclease YncB( thermonuclease family)
MFGWNRKSEGSDVRTTFAMRREQLRQRVVGAGRAVGSRFQATGAATAAGLRTAGAAVIGGAQAGRRAAASGSRRVLSGMTAAAAGGASLRKAGAAVLGAARAGGGAAAVGARRVLAGSATLAAGTSQKVRGATGSLAGGLARPGVAGTLAAAGTLFLGLGIGRYRGAGLDSEAIATLAIGGALTATLLPLGLSRLTEVLPGLPTPVGAMAAVGVAVLAAAAVWSAQRDTISLAGIGGGKEVVGRASVVAGDVLKVADTTVRLSGIEAPERAQLCGKDAGKWRCAEAARVALSKVVGGRPVRCRLGGTDSGGSPLGHCTIDSVDINADLVRQGYAFAEGGASSRYAGHEKDARTAKAGMWVADIQRPAEFRAKVWEEAKRRAPDGCPIKGQVTGAERVYVVPGTPTYERLRVQASRGDRWFCSEQDAASAGFKAAQRG